MNNPFEIRPFDYTLQDYEAVIRIWNASWLNLIGFQDRMRYEDELRDPRFPLHRLVAIHNCEVVGYGDLRRLPSIEEKNTFYLSLQVLPEFRRRGIGESLYRQLVGLLEGIATGTLLTDTFDTLEESIQFLEKRGFYAFMRYPLSILDVIQIDLVSFDSIFEKVKQSGVCIKTIAQLALADAEWRIKLWQLDNQIHRDAPAPLPYVPLEYDEYLTKKIEADWFRPDLWLIALDGEQWIGESALEPISQDHYWTHITGVLKTHRRKGIATALKLRMIEQVRRAGGRYIQTSNEENNPMYLINQHLGFRPEPSEVHFRKKLA